MKVTLINYTPDAEALLIFTKSTRLEMKPGMLDEIKSWDRDRILSELLYISQTIPSSWEFIDYVFAIEGVSRAFTHQFVRNRHGSYAQQSLRVVNVEEGFDFVMPERIAAAAMSPETGAHPADGVEMTLHDIKATYAALIESGVAPEDARSILPTNIATNIVAKFNLRTMSELAKSRTGGRTQGEYVSVMNAMADEVIKVHPWAEQFMFPKTRDLFKEIETFAEEEFGGDLLRKGRLLKIVDAMRKEPRQ